MSKFNTIKNKVNKKQIKPEEFLNEFFEIMKGISLRNAYLIFPHYIRTIQNEELKYDL
jgi:hypothetical protein